MTAQQLTLVVPLTPNVRDGESDDSIRAARYRYWRNLDELELALVILFGGYTAVDGRGAWDNDGGGVLHEDVRVYTLSAIQGKYNGRMTPTGLAALRQRVKDLLDQRAVYLAAYDLAEKPIQ